MNGTTIRKEGPWTKSAQINIDLSKDKPFVKKPSENQQPSFVLQGRVVDEQGHPIAGAMIRVPNQSSWTGYRISKTDQDGTFRADCRETIDHLTLVYPPMHHHVYIRLAGPWSKDATVAFDFSDKKLIVLQGKVWIGKGKTPVADVNIQAFDQQGRMMVEAFSDSQGAYKMTTNERIVSLRLVKKTGWNTATKDIKQVVDVSINEPINRSQDLNVDLAKFGFFLIEGTAKDSKGKPWISGSRTDHCTGDAPCTSRPRWPAPLTPVTRSGCATAISSRRISS